MQVKNGDVILHVETAGDQSAPPLLLMHGITVSGRTWDWFVPTLAARFRVLTLDFRGHGKSGRAPGDYQMQAYVTDAIAVLEELADGPAIVIGHSLGGMTGAALMQQRPDLVKAAVLEDPPLGDMDDRQRAAWQSAAGCVPADAGDRAGGAEGRRTGGGDRGDDGDDAVGERSADG